MVTLKIIICTFLFTILVYPGKNSPLDDTEINQFISTQKLNNNCLLVKFGTDAVTAVNTKDGVVIIDAGISSGLTSRYKKIIEKEFQRNDFTYVINTHSHFDHNGGNSVFSGAIIAAHENYSKEISNSSKSRDKNLSALKSIVEEYEMKSEAFLPYTKEWNDIFMQKTRYLYAYYDAEKSFEAKQPDITFTDSLRISLTDFTIEMYYFGNCHSCSDILIYIPEMKILFTGDLFSKYGRPAVSKNISPDKDKWLRSVKWIENRINNIDKIISGHGDILTLNDLIEFNESIKGKVFFSRR